jgi:hypothetical protein
VAIPVRQPAAQHLAALLPPARPSLPQGDTHVPEPRAGDRALRRARPGGGGRAHARDGGRRDRARRGSLDRADERGRAASPTRDRGHRPGGSPRAPRVGGTRELPGRADPLKRLPEPGAVQGKDRARRRARMLGHGDRQRGRGRWRREGLALGPHPAEHHAAPGTRSGPRRPDRDVALARTDGARRQDRALRLPDGRRRPERIRAGAP